jgi:hypothetical protein
MHSLSVYMGSIMLQVRTAQMAFGEEPFSGIASTRPLDDTNLATLYGL